MLHVRITDNHMVMQLLCQHVVGNITSCGPLRKKLINTLRKRQNNPQVTLRVTLKTHSQLGVNSDRSKYSIQSLLSIECNPPIERLFPIEVCNVVFSSSLYNTLQLIYFSQISGGGIAPSGTKVVGGHLLRSRMGKVMGE